MTPLFFGLCLSVSHLDGFQMSMVYAGEKPTLLRQGESQVFLDLQNNQGTFSPPPGSSIFEEILLVPETEIIVPEFLLLSQGETVESLPIETVDSQEKIVQANQRLTESDPELGNLRLREIEQPPAPSEPAEPILYLLGRVGYFKSDNVFSLAVDPIDDDLIWAGLTLLAMPSLGENTSLLAGVSGNLIRYGGDRREFDYDQLKLNLSLRQQLTNEISAEVGWMNQHLFDAETGDRFLDENSLFIEFDREDKLTQELIWRSFYQFRAGFADPDRRSQITNLVGTSLSYYPLESLEVALDYQFNYTDFTQQERNDSYHQLVTRLSYTISANSQAYLFGGRSFGESSDSTVDFDGFVFGVGVNFIVPWY